MSGRRGDYTIVVWSGHNIKRSYMLVMFNGLFLFYIMMKWLSLN